MLKKNDGISTILPPILKTERKPLKLYVLIVPIQALMFVCK